MNKLNEKMRTAYCSRVNDSITLDADQRAFVARRFTELLHADAHNKQLRARSFLFSGLSAAICAAVVLVMIPFQDLSDEAFDAVVDSQFAGELFSMEVL